LPQRCTEPTGGVRFFLYVAMVVVAVSLSACSSGDPAASQTVWRLDSLVTESGGAVDLSRERPIYAVIESDGARFWGHNGCYFYSNTLSVDGSSIAIGRGDAVRELLSCSEATDQYEEFRLAASQYVTDGDTLTITGPEASQGRFTRANISDIPDPINTTDGTPVP